MCNRPNKEKNERKGGGWEWDGSLGGRGRCGGQGVCTTSYILERGGRVGGWGGVKEMDGSKDPSPRTWDDHERNGCLEGRGKGGGGRGSSWGG